MTEWVVNSNRADEMDQTRSLEKCYQNGLADERDSRSGQPNVTRNVQLALYSAVENSVG